MRGRGCAKEDLPGKRVEGYSAAEAGNSSATGKLSLHTFFLERKYAPLAQLVEQLTLNQWVPGSNP